MLPCTPDGLAWLLRLGRLPLLRRLSVQCCSWPAATVYAGGAFSGMGWAGPPGPAAARLLARARTAPRPLEHFMQLQLEVLTNFLELQASGRAHSMLAAALL